MSGWTGKGFYYAVSGEALGDYRRLPAWEKLLWLQQANRLVDAFASMRVKRLHDDLRSGRI